MSLYLYAILFYTQVCTGCNLQIKYKFEIPIIGHNIAGNIFNCHENFLHLIRFLMSYTMSSNYYFL